MRHFDIAWVRAQFPSLALEVNGHTAAFLDGPAGTQVPRQVIDAVRDYYLTSNANTCGAFLTSRRNDAMIAEARRAVADLTGCAPEEVVFGPNMTTVTFHLSRSIGRELAAGDEIIVTTLDHDANVGPWRALEEGGIVVRQVDIRDEDCTLDLDDFRRKLNSRTRLVAVGLASNAVGTLNPVGEIVRLARDAGAMVFLDAVHYTPHGPLDFQALNCDFLALSAYKFFGPHTGILCGRRELFERLRPYKVRPAPDFLPDRWELGTQVQEALAGLVGCVNYLAELGRRHDPSASGRRAALAAAYCALQPYERSLALRFLAGVREIPGVRVFGIADPARIAERCSTFGLRVGTHTPLEVATYLGDRGIFTWDGNFYALNLTERLGLERTGGLLRAGLVHYNTAGEVDRLLAALREFVVS